MAALLLVFVGKEICELVTRFSGQEEAKVIRQCALVKAYILHSALVLRFGNILSIWIFASNVVGKNKQGEEERACSGSSSPRIHCSVEGTTEVGIEGPMPKQSERALSPKGRRHYPF